MGTSLRGGLGTQIFQGLSEGLEKSIPAASTFALAKSNQQTQNMFQMLQLNQTRATQKQQLLQQIASLPRGVNYAQNKARLEAHLPQYEPLNIAQFLNTQQSPSLAGRLFQGLRSKFHSGGTPTIYQQSGQQDLLPNTPGPTHNTVPQAPQIDLVPQDTDFGTPTDPVEEATKNTLGSIVDTLPPGRQTRAKALVDLRNQEGIDTAGLVGNLQTEAKGAELSTDERRQLKELQDYETNLHGLATQYRPGVVGAGKFTALDRPLGIIGDVLKLPVTELPGTIDEGQKQLSLKQQGRFSTPWAPKPPSVKEAGYKDQYEQTVQSLANVFAKGDKGQTEQGKANAREWLATPNTTDRYYKPALKSDIQDSIKYIESTLSGYQDKDLGEYANLGSKLRGIDISMLGDVSTPPKANAAVRSLVQQGMSTQEAVQIVAPIVQKQIQGPADSLTPMINQAQQTGGVINQTSSGLQAQPPTRAERAKQLRQMLGLQN